MMRKEFNSILITLIFLIISCGDDEKIVQPENATFADDAVTDMNNESGPIVGDKSAYPQIISDENNENSLPRIDYFLVNERDEELTLVPRGEKQVVKWKTSFLNRCSLQQGNTQISDSMSGEIEVTFDACSLSPILTHPFAKF